MFWLGVVLLSLFAAGFILLPLLLRQRETATDRDAINLVLFREKIAALDADPTIDGAARAQLEIEAKRDLLADNNAVLPGRLPGQVRKRGLLVTALLVPVAAVFFYTDLGLGLGAITDHELTRALRTADPSDQQAYRYLVQRLAYRAAERPDNTDLQFLLARTYTNLGEFDQAVPLYQKLTAQFPGDVNLPAYLAEALFLADGRQVTARVQSAIDAALRLNPHDLTMMEISAIGAVGRGDREAALDWFRRALATGATGERANLIRMAMSQLGEQEEPRGGRAILVSLSLADDIRLPAGSVIFVFARAQSGPPAPLAVQRIRPGELPVTLRLDETMAMMPGMSLADFDPVQVIARVSETGEVVARPGDYEVRSGPLNLGDEPVAIALVIKDRLPADPPQPVP